jgi:hypothetical protein
MEDPRAEAKPRRSYRDLADDLMIRKGKAKQALLDLRSSHLNM